MNKEQELIYNEIISKYNFNEKQKEQVGQILNLDGINLKNYIKQ